MCNMDDQFKSSADEDSPNFVFQPPDGYKPRKSHKKSRNGCMPCRERRIKCDEGRPCCNKCTMRLQRCVYRRPPPPKEESKDAHISNHNEDSPIPIGTKDHVPSTASEMKSIQNPPSYRTDGFPLLTQSNQGQNRSGQNTPLISLGAHDSELLHHFLTHTSRTLSFHEQSWYALRIGIPTLAFRNKAIMHSLLALAASCKCHDMILDYKSTRKTPNTDQVIRLLRISNNHHTQSLTAIQEVISQGKASDVDVILANAALLIPFSFAYRKISSWLHWTDSGNEGLEELSWTSPREHIICLRGIQIILQRIDSYYIASASQAINSPKHTEIDCPEKETTGNNGGSSTSLPIDLNNIAWQREDPVVQPVIGQHHALYSILKTTSTPAFEKLCNTINLFSQTDSSNTISIIQSSNENINKFPSISRNSIEACASAFNVLKNIATEIFGTPLPAISASLQRAKFPSQNSHGPAHVSPWLRHYLAPPTSLSESDPLNRPILSFFIQVPDAYINLLTPIFDYQGSDSPCSSGMSHSDSEKQHGLSFESILALEIYAHWLVLVILVEEESWWIGDFGRVGLQYILRTHRNDILALHQNLQVGCSNWWPECMYNISKELNKCDC